MHYVVDFPLPDASRATALAEDLPASRCRSTKTWTSLSREAVRLRGGDIRNVALDAAFLAAQNGRVVTMKLVVQALARQMTKQGRVATPADFKQYYELLPQVG